MDISESGASPEEIQEALQEILKQNEGNFFIQQYMKPPEAIEYQPIAPEVEAALEK